MRHDRYVTHCAGCDRTAGQARRVALDLAAAQTAVRAAGLAADRDRRALLALEDRLQRARAEIAALEAERDSRPLWAA